MDGGEGADTYVLSQGDGALSNGQADSINDVKGANTLEFDNGIAASDITAQWAGGADVVLQYGASDYVYVTGGLTGAIANVAFAEGVETLSALLHGTLLASPLQQGTSGSDLLYAGESGTATLDDSAERNNLGRYSRMRCGARQIRRNAYNFRQIEWVKRAA